MRDFDANDWDLLTPAEKIAYCHRQAIEVGNEAGGIHGTNKEAYLRPRRGWTSPTPLAEGKPAPFRDLGIGPEP